MIRSEELQQQAYDAEEEDKEVYISYHPDYPIIKFIEIDGEEFINEDYEDEISDYYWTGDYYRAVERALR